MESLVLIAHVLLAIALVALVLLQQGKGAEAGAAFGSGASQTMFGSQGSTNFLSKVTALAATGIFVTSFTLAVYAKQKAEAVADQGVPDAALIESQNGDVAPVLDAAPVRGDSDIPPAE